jgi:hypothetical protein
MNRNYFVITLNEYETAEKAVDSDKLVTTQRYAVHREMAEAIRQGLGVSRRIE